MDDRDDQDETIRKNLKMLLLHLAAKYENPGQELHGLLQEVIGELHDEVEKALQTRSRLRLVSGASKDLDS
jgi:hypothetical protein